MSASTVTVLLCLASIICGIVGQSNDVRLSLPRTPADTSRRELQGPPGKRGAVGGVGPKGLQGQKGEPGDVESCGCKPGDVIDLKEQVRILQMKFAGSCFDGIIYDNQCIRLPYTYNKRITFAKAQEYCNSLNSTLAEIRSDEMFDRVYSYLLMKYKAAEGTKSFYRYVWLGSTFVTIGNRNNEVTLSDGSKVRLTKWYPGRPLESPSSSTWMNLYIEVNSDVGSIWKGILNNPPTSSCIPLCSYNI